MRYKGGINIEINNFIKKILIFIIIILFVGASTIPNISGNIFKSVNLKNIKNIDNENPISEKSLIRIVNECFLLKNILNSQKSFLETFGSENGILLEEWRYDMHLYYWGFFGSSPGIADLGFDVNAKGNEPDEDMEIVTGSDECSEFYPELNAFAPGIWRCFDSQGNIEWAKNTFSDESRGDVVIVDINNDNHLEIAGGTTSGKTVEVMDRFGDFFWTFPNPPGSGEFMWPSGPAVADVMTFVDGQELIIGNRHFHEVYALDGDNSDGINEGYSWPGGEPWDGVEGVDWDILWVYTVPCNPPNCRIEIYSTIALGDVDNDGTIEAIFGATDGYVYILNGRTGVLEWRYKTQDNAFYASAALADIDNDDYLEIVIGASNGKVYALQWNGVVGSTEWRFQTGGPVYSSASIGDIDGDGGMETVVGSFDGKIYSLNASGFEEWNYTTNGRIYSSPALANRNADKYAKEWPMFRKNPERTGFYGENNSMNLDVYVGSEDKNLYLLSGNNGSLIDKFLTSDGGYIGYQGIHTSPSIADVDGDYKLEIFFYDWGQKSAFEGHTFWALEDSESGSEPPPPDNISTYVDIKPGSWPNPINVKKKGVLPVAVCGTDDFDVTTIDPSTIEIKIDLLEPGVSPTNWNYEDVATPWTGEEGGGHDLQGDGYIDLKLMFSNKEVVDTLDLRNYVGETIPIYITGNLKEEYGSTPIEGHDYVRILDTLSRIQNTIKHFFITTIFSLLKVPLKFFLY